MTAISHIPAAASGTRRAARLNVRVARRLGWKRDDIHVLEYNSRFIVSVAGLRFDVLTDKKLVSKLGNTFGATLKERETEADGHLFSVKVPGSVASKFCATPNEALARAILATPRRVLRTFF
jgi:hypothetical protein